jgi:hypothetical protein
MRRLLKLVPHVERSPPVAVGANVGEVYGQAARSAKSFTPSLPTLPASVKEAVAAEKGPPSATTRSPKRPPPAPPRETSAKGPKGCPTRAECQPPWPRRQPHRGGYRRSPPLWVALRHRIRMPANSWSVGSWCILSGRAISIVNWRPVSYSPITYVRRSSSGFEDRRRLLTSSVFALLGLRNQLEFLAGEPARSPLIGTLLEILKADAIPARAALQSWKGEQPIEAGTTATWRRCYPSSPAIPYASSFFLSVVRCRPRLRAAAAHWPRCLASAAAKRGGSTCARNSS